MMLIYIIAISLNYGLLTYLNGYVNKVQSSRNIVLGGLNILAMLAWIAILSTVPSNIAVVIIVPIALMWIQLVAGLYLFTHGVDRKSHIHQQYMNANMYVTFIFAVHQIAILAHYIKTA